MPKLTADERGQLGSEMMEFAGHVNGLALMLQHGQLVGMVLKIKALEGQARDIFDKLVNEASD